MKLSLQVYTETALLRVQERVTETDLKVLDAGLMKVTGLKVNFFILDFSEAIMDEKTAFRAREVKMALMACTFKCEIVTLDKTLGKYRTLDEVLLTLQTLEAKQLRQKYALEKNLANLKSQKEALAITYGAIDEIEKGFSKLTIENSKLKNQIMFYLSEIEGRLATYSAIIEDSAPLPEDVKAMQQKLVLANKFLFEKGLK